MRGTRYDVAIVGCGPSGAIAAALLARAGHKVFVCDQITEIYALPRAIALDHEILRLFQQLGLADAIAPHMEPFTDSHFFGVDGQLIRRMTMLPPPHPQAWTPSVVFNQPAVETAIRAMLAAEPNVTLALGQSVRALSQDRTGATLVLSDRRAIHSAYVIGCDGASSTVRGLAGIELDDLGFDEPWLVVDVLANPIGLARLPTHSAQYCEPERPSSYVIGPGNHRRWEISLNPGEDPKALATAAGTWKLLERWIKPHEGELWRQAAYRFHALVAQRWRAGRVFLAGDAAHQQPPFLGQGMCQGLRDVTNIAWKLHAVLAHGAPDALLDTYGVERKAHVRELTTRLKAIGGLIGERNVERARARDRKLLDDAGGRIVPTPRQDVLPRLMEGAFAQAESTASGTLFPQPWIQDEGERVRMDDELGCGWRLVTRGALPAAVNADGLAGFRSASLAELDEADGVVAVWFDKHACAAALVRPDHYVFGTANNDDATRALVREARAMVR